MKNFTLLLLYLLAFNSSAQFYNTDSRVHEVNDERSGINQSNDVFEPTKKRTCSINYSCLEELEILLDKESDEGVYKACKDSYSEHKNCCSSPSSCVKDYAPDFSPLTTSFDLCSDKSQLNSISQNIINKTCEVAEEQCPVECDEKLKDLTKKFKTCFNLKFKDSIKGKLLKAKLNPTDICYKKMLEMDKKYKKTFSKRTSIKDELKSKEVIKCEEISDFKQTTSGRDRLSITTTKTNSFICSYIKQRQEAQNKKAKQNNKPEQKAQAKPAEQDSPLVEGYQFFTVEDKKRVDKEFLERQMNREKRKEEEKQKKQKELEDKALERKKLVLKHKEHLDKIEKAKEEERIKKFGKRRKKSGLNYEAIEQMEKEEAERNGIKGRTLRVGAAIVAGASAALTGIKNLPAKTLTKLKQTFSAKAQTKKVNAPLFFNNSTPASFIVPQGDRVDCENIIHSIQVFQSVEAPQIESMEKKFKIGKQEIYRQGPDSRKTDFDLVRNKEAYIKINFNKVVSGNITMVYGYKKSTDFWFRRYAGYEYNNADSIKKHLLNGYYHPSISKNNTFIPDPNSHPYKLLKIPMFEKPFSDHLGTVHLDIRFSPENKKICLNKNAYLSKKDFEINILETKRVLLNFVQQKESKNCMLLQKQQIQRGQKPKFYYSSSDHNKFINGVHSLEVNKFIPEMFPISKNAISFATSTFNNGSCNNKLHKYLFNLIESYVSIGLLEDLNSIDSLRWKSSRTIEKKVVIASQSYRDFHDKNTTKLKGWQGLVIRKNFYFLNFIDWFVGLGSRDIAFVVEDAINTGSIAHELGHTFGQHKEYYRPRYHWQKKELCSDFINETKNLCYQYRMAESLKFGEIRRNQYSIMGNDLLNFLYKNGGNVSLVKMEAEMKRDLWIDRDTYQKIFVNLLSPLSRKMISDGSILAGHRLLEKIEEADRPKEYYTQTTSPIIVVSGIYLKDENKFYGDLNQQIFREGGSLSPSTSGVLDSEFSEHANLRVQLRLNKKNIYETRLFDFADVIFFYGDKTEKRKELKAVPLNFSLPMPLNGPNLKSAIKNSNLEITIDKVDQSGKVIANIITTRVNRKNLK